MMAITVLGVLFIMQLGREVSGSMMPQVTLLDVKCGRSGMTVHLTFDRSFSGVVYSKGHYRNASCKYVTTANTGNDNYMFSIPMKGCGTSGELGQPTKDRDMYYENTIIIQNDPLIQEEWDHARRLRCVWQHTMQKSISASPFKVFEPKKVSLDLDDQSIKTLMEIHGSSPSHFSSPATGYVYAGEEASIVIYVQEPTGRLDANVVSCKAQSPAGEVVDLVDEKGCVTKPELMTQFTKTREVTGVIADLMLFSYLKGFQVGNSPKFTISCRLEICKGKCSSPCQKTLRGRSRRQADTGNYLYDRETGNSPSAVVDLSHGVVVVQKEEVPGLRRCGLDTSITVAISCMFGVVIGLSVLCCCLAGRIKTLQSRMLLKNNIKV